MEILPIGRVIGNEGGRAEIEVLPEYQEGLFRIEENDRILVLYIFDRTTELRMRVHPRGDPRNPEVGVFASRSPMRPNHIAVTEVRLVAVEGNKLTVEAWTPWTAARWWTSSPSSGATRPTFPEPRRCLGPPHPAKG